LPDNGWNKKTKIEKEEDKEACHAAKSIKILSFEWARDVPDATDGWWLPPSYSPPPPF
jgi:hypothetical protein